MSIDWTLVGAVTVAAVVGSLVGARLVDRIPADALRRAFGWFVLAMGAFVLVQQAPGGRPAPGADRAGACVAAALGTCSAFVPRCPLRHAGIVGPARGRRSLTRTAARCVRECPRTARRSTTQYPPGYPPADGRG